MRILPVVIILVITCFITSCNNRSSNPEPTRQKRAVVGLEQDPRPAYQRAFDRRKDGLAVNFQMPVGAPDGQGYYNAQPFGENQHLGDDWNGTGGGDTDLGDAVYSVERGYVQQAMHRGPGWGNVVRVVHLMPDSSWVESVYAHLDTMVVRKGQWVQVGQHIGDIGNADGAYYAHLHFEIRNEPLRPLGGGYGLSEGYYVDPTEFISNH